jgi:DNA-directed RNA polymerase specialized sigma24 family protein
MTRSRTLDLINRATAPGAIRAAQEARSEYLVAYPGDEEIIEMGEILVMRSRAIQRASRDAGFFEEIAKALEALPRDLRAVVAMVDVEGRTYREASDVLGVPLGTVGSR